MKRLCALTLLLLSLAIVSVAQDSPQTARKVVIGVANAGVTGTTRWRLAKLTGAPSTAVIVATTDTDGAIGIVTANAGTSLTATIQTEGLVNCDFDGATTAGNYVQISATTAGKCHDAGASYPSSGQVLGRVLSTNGGAGLYQMVLVPITKAFTGAPTNATYVTNTPDATLSNEQPLSTLSTGLMKNTTGTGQVSIAVAGTDYESPLTFTTSDFDRAVNTVSIDYANGQAASGAAKGFLTAADWTTFNNKQPAITFGTGVQTALGVNVGSAGAPVINGGALGSPSSAGTMPAFTLGGTITGGSNSLSDVRLGSLTTNGPIYTSGGNGALNSEERLSPVRGGNGLDLSGCSGVNLFTAGTGACTGTSGTGNFARVTSPAFTTPNLGTPSAITLTNGTGLPISTGVSGLGANVATLLATFSKANLNSAVSDDDPAYVGTANTFTAASQTLSNAQPTLVINHTNTANFGAVNFQESGATKVALLYIGSTFATSTRREDVELANLTTGGGISLWTNSTSRFEIDSAGKAFWTSALTDATGTPGSLCYNTSTYEMYKNNALTCTVSSRIFKQGIFNLPSGSAFDRLRPVQFAYRNNPNRQRWGFIAEEVAAVDLKLADSFDANGNARSLDQNAILALTVKEVQELKRIVQQQHAEILTLRAEVKRRGRGRR